MALFDWTDIQALGSDYRTVIVRLSPDSLALLLSVEDLTEIGRWSVSGEPPTSAEADNIEAMTGQCFYELMANLMIGTIFPLALATLPDGALECDGSTHLRTDYPMLYAALDSAFVIDADTFIVPDLRGQTIIGAGTGSGFSPRAVNDAGGEEAHTLITAEIPAHGHGVTDAGHVHTEGIALPSLSAAIVGVPIPSAVPSAGVTGVATTGISIQSTGGGGAHENMQPFRVLRYAIWAL
jgi:microcystin-dependent protein